MQETDAFLSLQMLIEVKVAYLVGRFILAVVCRVLLHSVIRQVDKAVVPLVYVEVFAGCPQIALVVEVASYAISVRVANS